MPTNLQTGLGSSEAERQEYDMNSGRTAFAQLIEHLPHKEFHKCVARYRDDRYAKHFSCWDQYLAMAFAQFYPVQRRTLNNSESPGMIAIPNAADSRLEAWSIGTRIAPRSGRNGEVCCIQDIPVGFCVRMQRAAPRYWRR
jgi:hypothetical protein